MAAKDPGLLDFQLPAVQTSPTGTVLSEGSRGLSAERSDRLTPTSSSSVLADAVHNFQPAT